VDGKKNDTKIKELPNRRYQKVILILRLPSNMHFAGIVAVLKHKIAWHSPSKTVLFFPTAK
jgi:hypothetical protein